MDNTLRHRTLFGMLWVGIQRFGTVIISFLSNIVLARLLTPNDFGYIGMLMVFIAVANSFIDGGFGSALIQTSHPTQKDYSTVFLWNLFLGIVLYLILYFSAPLIADFYRMPSLAKILKVEGIILIINAGTIVQFNKLKKQMLFKKIASVNLSAAIVSVIVAIIYAYHGGGVWALVLQQIIYGVVNLIILNIIFPWKPSLRFSISSFKKLFNFGSFILLSSIINTIANNLNSLIVGRFFSASILGYLSQAQKIENVTSTSISLTVEQVTYPLLVEVNNDYNRMKKVLRLFNLGLLSIVLPAMLLILIGADSIIVWLFGEKWLPSASILQVLSIGGIFRCLQSSSYNVIAAIGRSDVLFKWTMIKRISGIGLIIAGFVMFGFQGVLWGMVLTSITIWLCNFWLVDKYIGYKFLNQIKDLLPVMLLGGLSYSIVWVLYQLKLFGDKEVVYCSIFLLIYIVPFFIFRNSAISELSNIVKSAIIHRK